MPAWTTWVVLTVLVFLTGTVVGVGTSAKQVRDTIANECKRSGAFTAGSVGFTCEARKAAPIVEY